MKSKSLQVNIKYMFQNELSSQNLGFSSHLDPLASDTSSKSSSLLSIRLSENLDNISHFSDESWKFSNSKIAQSMQLQKLHWSCLKWFQWYSGVKSYIHFTKVLGLSKQLIICILLLRSDICIFSEKVSQCRIQFCIEGM